MSAITYTHHIYGCLLQNSGHRAYSIGIANLHIIWECIFLLRKVQLYLSLQYYTYSVRSSYIHCFVSFYFTKFIFLPIYIFLLRIPAIFRSQWPSGLRQGCEAARLLRLRVRIPVAERSKAKFCGLALAGIACSNPNGACMSVSLSDLCFQAEVFATSRSFIQRSRNNCGLSVSVIKKPHKWSSSDLNWDVGP